MKILLASKSPRRRQLLKEIVSAENILVAGSDVSEDHKRDESADVFCLRIAKEKAKDVWVKYHGRREDIDAVVGADTVILFRGKIFGQPEDGDDAIRILKQLSGRCHEVITGVAVIFPEMSSVSTFVVRSKVWMHKLSVEKIKDYVATGEPLDKAGAYAIQGKGRGLVARYEGSYSNIVGLPVDELRKVLNCLQ
jgi:septum formation protein